MNLRSDMIPNRPRELPHEDLNTLNPPPLPRFRGICAYLEAGP